MKAGSFCGMVVVNNIFAGGERAGQFFLLMSCVNVGLVLVNFGHTTFYTRLLARHGTDKYRWGSDVYNFLLISTVFSIPVGFGMGYFYNFSLKKIFILTVCIIFYNVGYVISGIVRGHEQLTKGFMFQALHHIIWPILFMGTCFLFITDSNLQYVMLLGTYLLGFIVLGLYAVIWLKNNWEKQGNSSIDWNIRHECISFFITSITLVALPYMDKMILGIKKENLSMLAAYQGVAMPFTFYDVLMIAIGWVILPKLAKLSKNLQMLKNILLKGILFTSIVAIVMWLLSPIAIDKLYSGRFNDYAYLIPYLVLIGSLKVIFSILSSVIGGQVESWGVWVFCIGTMIMLIAGVFGMNYSLNKWGLIGMTIVLALLWLGRCFIASGVIIHSYFQKTLPK